MERILAVPDVVERGAPVKNLEGERDLPSANAAPELEEIGGPSLPNPLDLYADAEPRGVILEDLPGVEVVASRMLERVGRPHTGLLPAGLVECHLHDARRAERNAASALRLLVGAP